MSVLTRLRAIFGPREQRGRALLTEALAPAKDESSSVAPAKSFASGDVPIEASSIDDVVHVEEVSDARFFIGDLFRRRFHGEAPTYPRHYVAFYRESRARYAPLGYVHYTAFEDSYLCGGLVIDDRLYRQISASHRRLIRDAGGIAEKMLRDSFARLTHAVAIWGYVGDKQAEAVDLRVGFRHTSHPHIMVVWNRDAAEEERHARLERIVALGPF